ncbi:CBS domain-containing protein [Winogradskyella alexanderae]|uniref:CBS domain-containing protein n=1 Tax=Winogradskyella alexanderae TaxID=2877123 RepID=A0ABS7XS90_9FLAO|nr:CBS domain-containing protein [Winogradskyella alexanderae]MCA0131901.1 CBS domain-containing protein [Winogradskyella alexanderae]
MRIQVKDFMSAPVTAAMKDENVLEIRTLMKEKGIHAIPIISYANDKLKVDKTIEGIITATDISEEVSNDATIEDIMTASNVLVVHVDASAKAAAKMMLKHNVHHIVAMEDGEIKGMLSSLDFVKLVAEHSLE